MIGRRVLDSRMNNIEYGIINGSFENWTGGVPDGWKLTSPTRGFSGERSSKLTPAIFPSDGVEAFNFYRWAEPFPELTGTIFLEQTGINVDTRIHTKLVIDICAIYFGWSGYDQDIYVSTGLWSPSLGFIATAEYNWYYGGDTATSITLTIPTTARNKILTGVAFYYEVAIAVSSTAYRTQRHTIDNVRFA